MKTFYVASLSLYVLVAAADEAQAHTRGLAALAALASELGRPAPIEVYLIREATYDEIELDRWTQEAIANERR